jgi:deoxyribose-phosphate aldolase
MNLEGRLANALRDMPHALLKSEQLSPEELISLIDLTLLDIQATSDDITALATKAHHHQVAAICIYPEHLSFVPESTPITTAVVANFPSGMLPQKTVLQTITNAVTLHKVHEIDYVFPYPLYLSGQKSTALTLCHDVFQLCQEYHLTFKVIIETGALPSNEIIYELSLELIHSGCDFLKTSTGKIDKGATTPAVFAMLSAIVDSNKACGIKVSGGIRTIDQAISFIHLTQYMMNKKLSNECFRLGASSLLDNILKNFHQKKEVGNEPLSLR